MNQFDVLSMQVNRETHTDIHISLVLCLAPFQQTPGAPSSPKVKCLIALALEELLDL